jgi:hypothetical protein
VKGRYRWKGIGLGCWTGTLCTLVPNDVDELDSLRPEPVEGLDVMVSDMDSSLVNVGADR